MNRSRPIKFKILPHFRNYFISVLSFKMSLKPKKTAKEKQITDFGFTFLHNSLSTLVKSFVKRLDM